MNGPTDEAAREIMLNGEDIPSNETRAFVCKHAPAGASILEVGCGDGLLAEFLAQRSFTVLGVDASAEAVEKARRRGVEAVLATFPDFVLSMQFDVVLFTRSLHHVERIDEAVKRAHDLLSPEGIFLVEDFAYDEADITTIMWLHGLLKGLHVSGAGLWKEDSMGKRLSLSFDPAAVWKDSHGDGHPIHPAKAIGSAICRVFPEAAVEMTPYLYRYVWESLVPGERRNGLVAPILECEKRMIKATCLRPIGRRYVAIRHRDD